MIDSCCMDSQISSQFQTKHFFYFTWEAFSTAEDFIINYLANISS